MMVGQLMHVRTWLRKLGYRVWSKKSLETCPPRPPSLPTTIQTSVNFRKFAELYLRSLKTFRHQICQFVLLKGLFSVVSTDFPQLVQVKS